MIAKPAAAASVDLYIAVDHRGPVTVLRTLGDVDVYSAAQLRETVNNLITLGHHRLVLDLAGLEFTDSTGIGVMVGAHKRLKAAAGSIALAAVPENLVRVLKITGLTRVFPVYATADDAVTALQPPPATERAH